MPRIAGVDLPKKKRLVIALTYVYGIGLKRSQDILRDLKMDPSLRAEKVTEAQAAQLTSEVKFN